jgi:hypothetical protein
MNAKVAPSSLEEFGVANFLALPAPAAIRAVSRWFRDRVARSQTRAITGMIAPA